MTTSRRSPRTTALALAVGTAAAAALSACSAPPAAPHAPGGIAFVVGGRNNMPRPAMVQQSVESLKKAVLSKDTVFIVGVSGRPQLLYTEQISHDCDSRVACDAVVDDYVAKMQGLFAEVKAEAAEADPLGAIALAADQLAGLHSAGPRQIIMVDNGLQTTGDMPLQGPGALAVDPSEQAEHVVADGALPSLRDVDVLLTGLGSHYAPQPDLNRDNLQQIRTLWTTVLQTAGARVTVDPTPLDDSVAPVAGQPVVTPVAAEPEVVAERGGCFRIRDDHVGFLPGRAQFRDPAAARETLQPIARTLRGIDVSVSVVGTTALPEKAPFPLSTARATKVADTLAELGVKRTSMIVGGVGANFPDFVPDTDAEGRLIPSVAMQNRLVIVTPVGRSCADGP